MKKLLTTFLCLVLTLSIVLASTGCKDGELSIESALFNGNYVQVEASEITAFNESVAETEKMLNFANGVKFEYVENEYEDDEYEKERVYFETKMDEQILVLAGRISEEEKDDGRELNESSDIYYVYDTLFVNNGLTKESYQIGLMQYFNRALSRLETLTFDLVVQKYSNINGVKFYKEEVDGNTKIKLEFEHIEDADEKVTGKILFTYNAQKQLVALNVELIEQEKELFESDEYEHIIINFEAFNGDITLPSDLESYTPIATQKLPW